jgi:ribulose-phosphate 3-epimerase
MPTLRLGPSILTADFSRLGEEIESVAPHVDFFHLDVMDGHYVPNLTFGPTVVEVVRKHCELPLHVHLMITEPGKYAPRFIEAGADRISFHPEVVPEPLDVIAVIRDAGGAPGIAVHPDVGLDLARKHLAHLAVVLMMTVRPGFGGQAFLDEVVPKIESARQMVDDAGSAADVEVDGGVSLKTLERAVRAGGNNMVAGSAIYDGSDAVAAAKRLRAELDSLRGS